MRKMQEIRDEAEEALVAELETLQEQIYHLRSERLDSKTQQTHLIKEKRRERARILTHLKERAMEKKS